MPTPVSVIPSRIHCAAAAAIVLSTSNTRVRFRGMLLFGRTFTSHFCIRVRAVRVSQRETAFLRVGTEGEAPKDDGDRQDAVPQTRLEAIQEWFQVR